jgi:hypothetical protein
VIKKEEEKMRFGRNKERWFDAVARISLVERS